MAYADMLDRLPPPEQDGQNPRALLDSELGVSIWETPGWTLAPEPVTAAVEDEDMEGLTPPSWWHGDAEATQSFLGGVGIQLRPGE